LDLPDLIDNRTQVPDRTWDSEQIKTMDRSLWGLSPGFLRCEVDQQRWVTKGEDRLYVAPTTPSGTMKRAYLIIFA
jgi:hypothetical protein